MIDFDFAHEVMDNCMDVLLKYRITEEHIAELYKRTAILQRFPYAKAIECALLDDDIKICNYVKTHSCVLENTSPIEPDNFTHQLQQEYNRTKARFDHFTNDIRDIVKIDDIYKSLSHSQINQDENTHFSDSFIKQIKYRLLQARFISDGSHLFGIADWAFREKGVDIYFVQSPCVYNPGHCLYLNRTLDSYMDDIGEVEITIEKAAKICTKVCSYQNKVSCIGVSGW